VGYGARCTFLEKFDLAIYFSKIAKNKYKKIRPATSSRKPARESYGLWLQAGLMRTHPYLEFQQ
jgi:hypothetical protein